MTHAVYLGQRFGPNTQGLASLTFPVTRLLAEGVRLSAGAIPIKLLLAEFGLDVNYFVIVLAITAVTVAYTYVGGIEVVVWTDFGTVVFTTTVNPVVELGGLISLVRPRRDVAAEPEPVPSG